MKEIENIDKIVCIYFHPLHLLIVKRLLVHWRWDGSIYKSELIQNGVDSLGQVEGLIFGSKLWKICWNDCIRILVDSYGKRARGNKLISDFFISLISGDFRWFHWFLMISLISNDFIDFRWFLSDFCSWNQFVPSCLKWVTSSYVSENSRWICRVSATSI